MAAKVLKDYARKMRNNSTKGEIKFWCELVRKGKSGYQFYRQKVIDNYIADFYCAQLKLVVEIDGSSQDGKEEYDMRRDKHLESLGLRVLHIRDDDVKENFALVEKQFWEAVKSQIPLAPFSKKGDSCEEGAD